MASVFMDLDLLAEYFKKFAANDFLALLQLTFNEILGMLMMN